MKHQLLESHTKVLGRACFLAVSAGAALSATATIIYQENFDGLTAGSDLNGQGGWTKTGDTLSVLDQGSGDYAAAGATSGGTWFEYTVPLGTTISAGWLWTTYTLEQNSSDTSRGAVLALYETAAQSGWNAQGVQYAATGNNTWQIRPPGDFANSVSTVITVATPDTIIGGVNLDTGTAYIWVNPDGTDSFDPADGGTADATLTNSKLTGPMSHIILNGRNAATSPIYDDIMVTTTSDELGLPTVPEPSITLLGGLGLLGLLRRRRG